jgi:transposase
MYDTYFVNKVLNIYYNRKHFKLSVDMLAKIFIISKSTIYEWRNNPIISYDNIRIFNKKPSIFEYDKLIVDHVIKNKIVDHEKIYNIVKSKFNKNISKRIIYKILKRNNVTCKKVQTHKYPYSKNKFNKDVDKLRKLIKCRKNRIISVDETSIDFIVPSNYGWSKKGTKCTLKISNKRYRVSLLIAISKNKIVNYHIKEGSFKGVDFNDFMNETVNINGHYRYLMDNATIHHNKLMDLDIKSKIIYNLPYYPEFNPIEYFFNTLKKEVRKINLSKTNNIDKLSELLDTKFNKTRFDGYFNKSYDNLKI